MNWRGVWPELVALVGAVLVLLEAPFRFCHKASGNCYPCSSAMFFDPPLRGSVMCAVHWEQLLLRLAAVLAVWAILRYLANRSK